VQGAVQDFDHLLDLAQYADADGAFITTFSW
jgi:hypothetical protein